MRVFKSGKHVMNEVSRDLLEMGIERRTMTMQDKRVVGDSSYDTKELINYSFCLTGVDTVLDDPSFFSDHILSGKAHQVRNWCRAEFHERIAPIPINPGEAWELRQDVWYEFLQKHNGRFAYTYNERIRTQLEYVIFALNRDPDTRQAVISIWNPVIDVERITRDRVPCSLTYHFMASRDSVGNRGLNLIYSMRSCDFITHMSNDMFLACSLLRYMSERTAIPVGHLFMNISSLHYYRRDEVALKAFMEGR